MNADEEEFFKNIPEMQNIFRELGKFLDSLPHDTSDIMFSVLFFSICMSKDIGMNKPHFLSHCSSTWELLDEYEKQIYKPETEHK